MTLVTALYAAKNAVTFPDSGKMTAIFKDRLPGRVSIGAEGIIGDMQADRVSHGGPDKALHHYNADHYPKLAARFPKGAASFVAGSIGENMSSSGLDETMVTIGDVFAFGSARLQVSQPRTPCWKIDARYGITGVGKFISNTSYQGWYYRVLEEGEAEAGDALKLLDRNVEPVTIASFWSVWRERPPNRDKLTRLMSTPGLAIVWQRYLNDYQAAQRNNPVADAAVVPEVWPRRD